jgi:predicted nucleic-acid-binding Zn-ribbon protein
MKDGRCPKCGANSVYMRENVRTPTGAGMITLKGTVLGSAAPLDNYVCADCGYVELYMPDKKHLDYVAENWDRVPDDEERGETRRLPTLPG